MYSGTRLDAPGPVRLSGPVTTRVTSPNRLTLTSPSIGQSGVTPQGAPVEPARGSVLGRPPGGRSYPGPAAINLELETNWFAGSISRTSTTDAERKGEDGVSTKTRQKRQGRELNETQKQD